MVSDEISDISDDKEQSVQMDRRAIPSEPTYKDMAGSSERSWNRPVSRQDIEFSSSCSHVRMKLATRDSQCITHLQFRQAS